MEHSGNPKQAPLPFAWGVLYAKPNPDDTSKMCANCIASDELVLVDGVPCAIGSVRQGNTLTQRGWKQIRGVVSRKRQPIVQVKSTAGLVLRVTPDHRFHTEDGWVAACDLRKGLLLTTLQEAPLSSKDEVARREAFLLGGWTGDGWQLPNGLGFCFHGSMREAWQPLLDYAAELFSSCARPVSHYSKNGNFFAISWRNKAAQALKYRFQKEHIPDQIWRSTPGCIGAYLKGLFTSDGSISVTNDPRWNSKTINVIFNNTQPILIQHMQLLLRMIGIPSTINKQVRQPRYKDLYALVISRKAALDRFQDIVGFADKRRASMLYEGLKVKKGRAFLETVKSVREAGRHAVTDISVPATRSFYANGFLVHNCVMWSWRDSKCSIHKKSLDVPHDAICGYHVFGKPMETRMDHPGMDPVDPALSGFDIIPAGTYCGSCIYYEATSGDKGVCHGVAKADGVPPQPVDFMGCCARWEGDA